MDWDDDSSSIDSEAQQGPEELFVLRLPPAISDALRSRLRNGNLRDMAISIDEGRHGKFTIDNKQLKLTVLDMPTRIETYKTIDRVNFYKTADIGQMFLVEQDGAPPSTAAKPSLYTEKYQLYSGLTPPTKDLSRRWKKRKPKDVNYAEAEMEVLKLMRGNEEGEILELVDADEIDKLELEAGALGGEGLEYTESIPEALLHAAHGEKKKKKKKHRHREDGSGGAAGELGDGTERRAKKKKKKDKKSRRAVESLAASLEANLESTFGHSLMQRQQQQQLPSAATATSTSTTSSQQQSSTAPPLPVSMPLLTTQDNNSDVITSGGMSTIPSDIMEVVEQQQLGSAVSDSDMYRKQRIQELQAHKNQLEIEIDQTNANLRSVQLALSTTMRANPVLRQKKMDYAAQVMQQLRSLETDLEATNVELLQLQAM